MELTLDIDSLIVFLKNEFNASNDFCQELKKCETDDDVSWIFNSEDFKELIFPDYYDDLKSLEDDVSDLESDIKSLKSEITDLENEITESKEEYQSKGFNPHTFWEEEKFELFKQNQHKFTPLEFEELMTKNYKK